MTNYFKIVEEKTNDDDLVLRGYVVVYGGEDLTGEHFTRKTSFDSSYTEQDAVLIDWEHGIEPDDVKSQPGRDDILGRVNWGTAESDDIGLLVDHVLKRRQQYVSHFIEPLARAGILGSSSEAVAKGVKKRGGEILAWPLKRQSFTVTPAEPRLLTQHQLQVIKSLPSEYQQHPHIKAILGDKESAAAVADGDNKNIISEEKMTPEQMQALIAETVKAVLESQPKPDFKAMVAEVIDEIPANKKAGFVEVVEDETDKKYKAMPHKLGVALQLARNIALSQPLDENQKAMKAILGANESVPEDGGFLVGTEISLAVEKRMIQYSDFASRADMRTIPANANSVEFTRQNSDSLVDGSRPLRAYRLAEGQQMTTSQMKFERYTIKPSDYAVFTYATNQVARSASLLEAEIMDEAPRELAFILNNDMMNANIAGYPKGILNSNVLVTVAKEGGQEANTVNFKNIVKMYARFMPKNQGDFSNSAWFINRDVFPQLPQLSLSVGTGGQPVYLPATGLASAPYGTLMGLPVIPTFFCQTLGTVGDIVLADWNAYKLANRGGIETASSMHFAFDTNQMAWRFIVAYDGQPCFKAPLTPLYGTDTLSPFVALATRS